jgi:hypothetical protein
MKKKHLLFIAIVSILISCNTAPHIPTNEERAENLISDCIKDCITYPESYETISTRIDSSFINVSKMEEIIELTEDCTDLYDKIRNLEWRIESAQSTMEIYNPKNRTYNSEHSRGNYNRAKAEKDEYELEFKQLNSKLEEKVLALRNSINDLYDSEINGWAVTHRFRCQNDYGVQMPPQEMLFFCDLNFETCQGWTAKQIESFFTIIECVEESETDKLLLNNLKDIRYIFNYF